MQARRSTGSTRTPRWVRYAAFSPTNGVRGRRMSPLRPSGPDPDPRRRRRSLDSGAPGASRSSRRDLKFEMIMPVLVESVRGAREPPATPPSRCTPPETTARSSRLYGPAFLLLAAAFALVSFGWVARWGGMDYSSSIKSLRVVVVGPASLATIAAILVGERVR